ncbi:TonB-dependent receptor [Hydrogenimonas sp.]|nr:TonB-dependent receptor [Hydrogenimonas sp.]
MTTNIKAKKMKKTASFIALSLVAAVTVQAEEVLLDTVEVEGGINTTIVKNVAGEEVRSADLADALSKLDPDIQLIRRSGIANDIILRGLRKDNINVLIDGAKIYGGCPNRMDPPISHILASNVERIVIKEGPFDVENFGTLGGLIEVDTLAPEERFQGEVTLNVGSWEYRKTGFRLTGGSEKVKFIVGASTESSGQYRDGEGRTLAEQVDAFADRYPTADGQRYAPMYHEMKAYKKDTAMAKVFIDIADNQELKLSYTANRSNDILYPNSKMDAKRDASDLLNIKYSATDLGELSKKLDVEFYNSWVDHPMGTYFRQASMMMGLFENIMFSRIYGGKIKNSMDLGKGTLSYGFDGSKRFWEGHYASNSVPTGISSIDSAVTENAALFAEYERSFGDIDMEAGIRYDSTSVGNDDPAVADNDYSYFSGYILGTYNVDETSRFFLGAGKSSRVPDGKELYFQMKDGTYVGNPNLNKTTNYEADIGFEKEFEDVSLKSKIFYSRLKDFIAYNLTNAKYENVDAKLYGISVETAYSVSDDIYVEAGAAYQRGRKDNPLTGQTDRDLPNVLPLKANAAVNYDFDETLTAKLSAVAAKGWSDYDSDNGEQKISGYTVFNLKIRKEMGRSVTATFGVDNILDRNYAVSNTYADMILVSGGGVPMLLNEPGRYYYCNLTLHF